MRRRLASIFLMYAFGTAAITVSLLLVHLR
jgi:hypothetical protein